MSAVAPLERQSTSVGGVRPSEPSSPPPPPHDNALVARTVKMVARNFLRVCLILDSVLLRVGRFFIPPLRNSFPPANRERPVISQQTRFSPPTGRKRPHNSSGHADEKHHPEENQPKKTGDPYTENRYFDYTRVWVDLPL